MARSGPLLSEAQWKKIASYSRSRPNNARAAVRGSRTGGCWKGFCGFCGAGLVGRICRRNSRIPRPAGGDCATGRSGRLVENLADVSERVERAPGMEVERVVSGREFRSGEKGLRSRKNQAGQGDQVDGGGRRPRSSSGKLPSLGIPGGSQTRGNDAGDDPGSTDSSCGSSETETGAGDCRQSPRQQSVAEAFAAARDRADLPKPEKSRPTGHAGWSRTGGATEGDGSSNGLTLTPGSETSDAWSSATTARSPFTAPSFTSPVS